MREQMGKLSTQALNTKTHQFSHVPTHTYAHLTQPTKHVFYRAKGEANKFTSGSAEMYLKLGVLLDLLTLHTRTHTIY